MTTPEQRLRDAYGFAFPDDFFRFREFLDRLPGDLLAEACDMRPAYPFAAAAGRPPREYPEHPLWEDRYYKDLPEFVTVFYGTTDGVHWGYFFDAPGALPSVVAHYWHSDTFEHVFDGDHLFEAVRVQVEGIERDCRDYLEMDDDPEEAGYYRERLEQLATVRTELARFWGADRPETGLAYFDAYDKSGGRVSTAPTRSLMGIVVPGGKYRPLSADPFARPAGHLHAPQIKAVTAEALRLLGGGFPGAALKLGHDLWVWANDFPECYTLLDAAYAALGREPLRAMLAEARAFREQCDRQRGRKN
jgi:hypothetical protein